MNTLLINNELFAPLFSDPEITDVFDTESMLRKFVDFEIALTRSLAELGILDSTLAKSAVEAMQRFEMDHTSTQQRIRKDGLAVPVFVQQLKAFAGDDLASAIHFGSTSQDLIDTALCLCLKDANVVIASRLEKVRASLSQLEGEFGRSPVMARTRMQAALPSNVSHRIQGWRSGLDFVAKDWSAISSDVEVLQFGGPVGDRRAYKDQGSMVASGIARELGVGDVAPWHTDRSRLIAYAGRLTQISMALGKIGTDLSLMSQQGIDEVRLAGGGGSSAMAHKQNPVQAEFLTTLARYGAMLIGGLHQSGIHEQERSGSAWTLEWMIVPSVVQTTALGLKVAEELLLSIEALGGVKDGGVSERG